MTPLVAFYSGSGKDHRGRSLADYMVMSVSEMERTHDYIQWMFPTRTASAFNPKAPIVTPQDQVAFTQDGELRSNLAASLSKFLGFLKLPLPAGASRPHWVHPGNHNYLRITRVLESLELLGLQSEAEILRGCLRTVVSLFPDEVGDQAPSFWGI